MVQNRETLKTFAMLSNNFSFFKGIKQNNNVNIICCYFFLSFYGIYNSL